MQTRFIGFVTSKQKKKRMKKIWNYLLNGQRNEGNESERSMFLNSKQWIYHFWSLFTREKYWRASNVNIRLCMTDKIFIYSFFYFFHFCVLSFLKTFWDYITKKGKKIFYSVCRWNLNLLQYFDKTKLLNNFNN